MTTVVLTSGTSWTVPSDCALIDTLELWGGNASGAGPQSTSGQGGGGGGTGAYGRWASISVTPGNVQTIAVGAGGPQKSAAAGTDGGATSIIIGVVTYAVAGGAKGLSGTGGTGGAGGAGGAAPTIPTPQAAFKGGDGAAGLASTRGGGGGGSPGSTSAGGNASAGTGGAGGTGSPAGTAGGNGGTTGSQNGVNGATPSGTGTPGSAGGGGYYDGVVLEHSGAGGGGQIVINYTTTGSGGDIPPARVADLIGFDPGRGAWAAAEATIGPGDTHRLFSSGALPSSFDADGTPSHVTVIQSYKTMNTNVAAYVNSVPANRKVILIYHHEPEADYAFGSQFVAEFKTQSDLIRAQARSNVRVAMCAGGFAYRDNGTSDVLAGNYLRGLGPYVDLFTKDIYQGSGGTTGFSWPSAGLANYPQFQNWLSLVTSASVVAQVKPLGITEYGVDDPVGDSARNARIQLDHDYLAAAFTPGGPSAVSPFTLQCWCYWWTDADPANPAQFTDSATVTLWKSFETAAGPSAAPVSLLSQLDIKIALKTTLSTPTPQPVGGAPAPPAAGFPQLYLEAGFITAAPVVLLPGTLILDDPVLGKLDTGRLGDSTAFTDITRFARQITISRASTRVQGPLLTYQAGTVSVVLDNSDGRFDFDNLTGPYVISGVSQVTAMVPARVRATFGNVEYGLFYGFADSWQDAGVPYDQGYAETTLTATDGFKVLAGQNLATLPSAAGVSELSGARVSRILTAAFWFTDHRRIAAGDSTLQGTTFGDTALNLLQLTADSEIGELYIDGSGNVVFRNRHAIISETRSTTTQGVFGDLPPASSGGGYGATYTSTYTGTVGGTGELPYAEVGRADDETTLANSVRATNVGGTAQTASNAASIRKNLFPRTYTRDDLILTTDNDALAWAQWVLAVSLSPEDRFDTLTIDPLAAPADLFPQVLARDIGDRITVIRRPQNSGQTITKDVFIRGIEHTIDAVAGSWSTTWTLQDASRYLTAPTGGPVTGFLILDDPVNGRLNTGKLAF